MKIILVSHVNAFAEATKEYILKMVQSSDASKLFAIGGDTDGGIGTDYEKIVEVIERDEEDTLIICDLGSAVLSSEAAAALVGNNVHVSNGSFVEGAFSASTLMFAGADFKSVINAAEEQVFKK
ncbi:PTS-dependent dihydroxyacetone kinase phosphotransferase subunit DhaM [Mycoplasma todarodis]|uniref:Dihydroxyacetone kinase n=1 Tax=Mycoplasma todarodis TaxID=1937191 RepID=A0A4V2NHZ4_9MOLU|nr:dihydroxyacetone kinase [Mycoplasma todarodis]TCG10778.1 dihydroxyacetone kinase [Mycoplasma todarodis]